MAKVTVKVLGLKKAIDDIRDYARRKHREALGVVIHSSDEIKKEARHLAPMDVGELKNNINTTIRTKGTRLKGEMIGEVISSAPYSTYVEFGSSPHFPPVSALEGWAARHGVDPYAVAFSISRKGTPAQPFMDPAYRKEKPRFIKAVRKVFSSP